MESTVSAWCKHDWSALTVCPCGLLRVSLVQLCDILQCTSSFRRTFLVLATLHIINLSLMPWSRLFFCCKSTRVCARLVGLHCAPAAHVTGFTRTAAGRQTTSYASCCTLVRPAHVPWSTSDRRRHMLRLPQVLLRHCLHYMYQLAHCSAIPTSMDRPCPNLFWPVSFP